MTQNTLPTLSQEFIFSQLDGPTRRQLAVVMALALMGSTARRLKRYSSEQAAQILDCGPKALQNARARRSRAQAAGAVRDIDPRDLASIPLVETPPNARQTQYDGQSLFEFLERTAPRTAAGARVDPIYTAARKHGLFRGFQSWMRFATPLESDSWPFAIQADGTPVDLGEALSTGASLADVRNLTTRQFADAFADAVLMRYQLREEALIEASLAAPETAPQLEDAKKRTSTEPALRGARRASATRRRRLRAAAAGAPPTRPSP